MYIYPDRDIIMATIISSPAFLVCFLPLFPPLQNKQTCLAYPDIWLLEGGYVTSSSKCPRWKPLIHELIYTFIMCTRKFVCL